MCEQEITNGDLMRVESVKIFVSFERFLLMYNTFSEIFTGIVKWIKGRNILDF